MRLAGGICHSPDKYLTPACNTHTQRESLVCQTLQLQCRPASVGCPLAPLSCEKLFRPERGQPESKTPAPYRDMKGAVFHAEFSPLLQVFIT